MNNTSEKLAELQTAVAQMRVNYKTSIVNREKQNNDIQIEILKRTKLIPVHKIQEISLPDLNINLPVLEPSIDTVIDTDDLNIKKMRELRKLIKYVSNQNQCKILKRMQDEMQ